MRMPAMSSPRTAGWPTLVVSQPTTLAAPRTIESPKRSGTTERRRALRPPRRDGASMTSAESAAAVDTSGNLRLFRMGR